MKQTRAVIVANAPTNSLIQIPKRMRDANNLAIVLDGAIDRWPWHLVTPNIWMGDFDSCQRASNPPEVERINLPDQSKTDLEKALDYCLDLGLTSIQIINAIGGRLDHTLMNIRLLRKFYHPERTIKIWDGVWEIVYLRNSSCWISGAPGEQCAIMGAPKGKIVESVGLKWGVKLGKPYGLEFGLSESACNQLSKDKAKIAIEGEALIMGPRVESQSA